MKIETEKEFMKQGLDALEGIYKVVCNLKSFDMDTLEPEKTALVIVDMVNGFVKQGQMASPRIKDIIEPIVDIKQKCDECGIQTIAFADCHCDEAVEFLSYPKHCLENSYESEIIDELKKIGVNRVIKKNSTNGFLQDEFLKWLKNNPKTTQFIVVGDCTDICVQQFTITLKTWFNMQNEASKIIVPINAVETYDSNEHNASLINIISVYNMMQNGIVVVKNLVRGTK